MSLLATLALAASASTATLPACSWDRPGVNPFMGDLVAAVDRYRDIPEATRVKLKARLQQRSYEDIAVITRDAIAGKADYAADIRDMHFGRGTVCRTVTRTKWKPEHQERGLVYCEDGHCLIVPTVCRNLSRVTRVAPRPVAGAASDESPAAPLAQTDEPLVFDPPAAGLSQPLAAPASFAATAQIVSLEQPSSPLPAAGVLGGGVPGFGPPPGVPPLPPGSPPIEPPGPGPLPDLPRPDPFPGVTPAVPEPSTWLLMGLGLAGFALRQRRSNSGAK